LGDEFTGELSDAQKTMLHDAGLSADGLKRLERDLKAAKKEADRLDGTRVVVETELRYRYEIVGQAPRLGDGVAQVRAAGGIVGGTPPVSTAAAGGVRGNMVLVGERGPELVDLAPGSTVIPAGQSAAMMAGANGAGGPVHLEVTVRRGFDQGLADAILDMLEFRIRTGGELVGSIKERL
jgi:hypothetical protein